MKKNKVIRLATVLLVLTLLTTSVVSGTFAKYTTEDKASDMARVAKWGVELQAVGNLFSDSYYNTAVLQNDANLSVQSYNQTDDVVAPGTSNTEGFTFKLNGTPEVKTETKFLISAQNIFLADNQYGMMIPVDSDVVNETNFRELYNDLFTKSGTTYTRCSADGWSSSATYYTLEDWVNVAADYYPVVYTLAGDPSNSTSYAAADDAAGVATNTLFGASDALAKAFNGGTDVSGTASSDGTYKTYEVTQTKDVNTNLATAFNLSGEKLTWSWVFARGGNAVGDSASWQDKADTILGNMMSYAAGGSIEGDIVYATANTTEGSSFTSVTYANGTANVVSQGANIAAYNYVTDGTNTIACLDTQFSVDIIVTQVD